MADIPRKSRLLVFTIWLMLVPSVGMTWAQDAVPAELDQLVNDAEKEFLLHELARIQPPERIRELAGYSQRQLDLGGGFYGMMPDQLANPDSIPIPHDDEGRLAAALCLARQRRDNLAALEQVNPKYAQSFSSGSLKEFLGQVSFDPPDSDVLAGLDLELDVTALTGFFAVLDDGEISADEAASLAALPSNQEMLQHRRNLGYVPKPLPDTETLATMIQMAGSTDPLDRLWCWIHSQNAFDYADLVQHADDYRRFLAELESRGDELVDIALQQIAGYTPVGIELNATFAMTVGWGILGWVTPDMAGINIEQAKNDWRFLLGTMIEETYHRMQLDLFPSVTNQPVREFSDLTAIDTGDPRYDRLFEILTYTVAEGAANQVGVRFAEDDLLDKAPAGAELLVRFVHQVIDEGDTESADALITEGLQGNGPLYGLGLNLAGLIAKKDGSRAVGEYQQQGPVAFFQRGAALAAETGEPIIAPEVMAAVDSLEVHLANRTR